MKELSNSQLMRYSRHIMLKDMDIDGQEKLWNSKVLIIGLGGLGCAVAQYLTASGIGELTLVDDDTVDITNLQRQVLHHEASIGLSKCLSAKASLRAINSEIRLNTIEQRLAGKHLADVITKHDIVIDCSDNLITRNELNLQCYQLKKTLVSGAAIRMEGQVSVYDMQATTPCYQCLSQHFGEQILTCVEAGVLSPVVGIVGNMQACEAIKVLAGIGQPLIGKLMLLDASDMSINTFSILKSPQCSVCGEIPFISE
ncbi:molybdopterin-synthase adenylyltransferase MoeB [Thalassotalea profundi]|nr:molybdopterin-synthase adenylyltransferase MoeB [Thalassotalea profundi]